MTIIIVFATYKLPEFLAAAGDSVCGGIVGGGRPCGSPTGSKPGPLLAPPGAPRVRGAVTWVGGGTAEVTPETGGPNLLARPGPSFFSQGILPTIGVGVFLDAI